MRAGWKIALAAALLAAAGVAEAHDLRCDKGVRQCLVVWEPTFTAQDENGVVAPVECQETFLPVTLVYEYPARIQYQYSVRNAHPAHVSVVGTVKEFGGGDLGATLPWLVTGEGEDLEVPDLTGFGLPVGATATAQGPFVDIPDYATCRELANAFPPCGQGQKEPPVVTASGVPEPPPCEGDDVTCRRCDFPYPEGTAFIDNRMIVEYDHGEAQCTARVICLPDFSIPE